MLKKTTYFSGASKPGSQPRTLMCFQLLHDQLGDVAASHSGAELKDARQQDLTPAATATATATDTAT